MNIVVVGGGAAGFFAAISAKAHNPKAHVQLLEKSSKLLAKVRISGGGRCNVAHHLLEPRKLARCYPRGEHFLKKAFAQWSVKDTVEWFGAQGVGLKTEEDGRMFPVTDSSQTIIDALVKGAMKAGVEVKVDRGVRSISPRASGFLLSLDNGEILESDRVIVTSGGHPKADGYAWLSALGVVIVPPVPSLFTFNLIDKRMADLMGLVAPKAVVRIPSLKLEAEGPVLITHWGLSGPAVLRLSAWGARELQAAQYRYAVHVNWIGLKEEAARTTLNDAWAAHPKKQAVNACPFELPERLWAFLLDKSGIAATKPCADIGKHDRNRLLDILVNDKHPAQGKTTFKEEFVTAGGVALEGVDPDTMQCSVVPGMFFAGEVLDIDGITGGFNFQAAWTTGWIAGKSAGTA